jgi:hypothetical protein
MVAAVAAGVVRMAGAEGAGHMAARAAALAAVVEARRLIAAAHTRVAETLQVAAAAAAIMPADIGGIRSMAAVRVQRRPRRE